MPRITANTLEQHQTTVGGYAYSAATIDHTIAPEQTLFTLCIDTSGSVSAFKGDLEKCVQAIIEGCKKDSRADYQMVRVLTFADSVTEVHGFKPLATCDPKDYANFIQPGGMTALYEAIDNAGDATDSYAAKLKDRDRDSNAIIVGITDGCNNVGGLTPASVKTTFERVMQGEHTESLLSVLIGVNMKDQVVKNVLAKLEVDGGFSQFLAIEDSNASTFAKIAGFVSQSVSAQSSHIGTGGPSKPINPAGLTF
jgi:uncharacterized protein YegL